MDSKAAALCPVVWGGDELSPQCTTSLHTQAQPYTAGLARTATILASQRAHRVSAENRPQWEGSVRVDARVHRPPRRGSGQTEELQTEPPSSLPLSSQNSARRPPPCPAGLATDPGRCHLKVTWLPPQAPLAGGPQGPPVAAPLRPEAARFGPDPLGPAETPGTQRPSCQAAPMPPPPRTEPGTAFCPQQVQVTLDTRRAS